MKPTSIYPLQPHSEAVFPLPDPGTRVLLANTHAIDVRLPWFTRHQPAGLLQIGTALRQRGCDVRFIDCLAWEPRKRAARRKVGSLAIERYELDLWEFGCSWAQLGNYVSQLGESGWSPDQVFVSCAQTTWWQAARDLIQHAKQTWFPDAEVVLGGVYPTLEPEHARAHTMADRIVVGSVSEVRDEAPDFSLYEPVMRPAFAGIYLYRSQSVMDLQAETAVIPRPPEDIAKEIDEKARLGVTEFAFLDDEVRLEQRYHFIETLKAIAALDRKRINLTAIGNISPRLIDGEMAHLMGKAGYRQVNLKCDVSHRSNGVTYDTPYDIYRACAEALHREAGFKPRSDQLTAMLLVGSPFDDIEAISERLIRLASIVGSVNLVQYQFPGGLGESDPYTPFLRKADGDLDLSALNCKLYPLSRLAGMPFEYYMELTRLAALLNSKYRSKTFDFLGDGLVAQAVQTSLRTHGYDPISNQSSEESRETIPIIPKLEH